MSRRHVFLVSLVLLFALSVGASGAAAPFPLAPGTTWTYQVDAKWNDDGITTHQATATWTMKVTGVVSSGQYTAARVSGYVSELAWYTSGQQPKSSLIVRDGDNRYYLIQDDRQATVLQRLRDRKDDLTDLLDASDVMLQFPLTRGMTFGKMADLAPRTDTWYCWAVEQAWRASLRGITGVSATAPHDIFQLAFRTNPDHQLLNFVPGIGITAYTYVHHGTVAESHARLIAFTPGK